MRVGTVSIKRNVNPAESDDFDRLWQAIGKNTGNLMFTEAMFRIIDADVSHLGFSFDPDFANENLDAVVIPAANWLSSTIDWDWLTNLIERLTVPVTLIGIGLQASTCDIDKVVVSESAKRFVTTIAERSPAISVRGDFTKKWLTTIGVKNVVTTGCPSLYMNIFTPSHERDDSCFAVQGTRYFASQNFNDSRAVEKHLFRLSASARAPMIYQSEVEELQVLVGHSDIRSLDQKAVAALLDLYGLTEVENLEEYLSSLGRVYFDLQEWSKMVGATAGVIGSRLHGSIIALNSGTGALLFGHDSRTQELIEFAAIPSLAEDQVLSIGSVDDAIAALSKADLGAFRDRRSENQIEFKRFLIEAGLPPQNSAMF